MVLLKNAVVLQIMWIFGFVLFEIARVGYVLHPLGPFLSFFSLFTGIFWVTKDREAAHTF